MKWIILILMLISGCMPRDDQGLYRKVTISCKIIAVNQTAYRWDNIVLEFPNGERCHVQVPRDLYQSGGVYPRRMWKWQAIERGLL